MLSKEDRAIESLLYTLHWTNMRSAHRESTSPALKVSRSDCSQKMFFLTVVQILCQVVSSH